MYVLRLRAIDLHNTLARLMDRIRVGGMRLIGVSAKLQCDERSHESVWDVLLRIDAEDADNVERLATAAQRILGTDQIVMQIEHDHRLRH